MLRCDMEWVTNYAVGLLFSPTPTRISGATSVSKTFWSFGVPSTSKTADVCLVKNDDVTQNFPIFTHFLFLTGLFCVFPVIFFKCMLNIETMLGKNLLFYSHGIPVCFCQKLTTKTAGNSRNPKRKLVSQPLFARGTLIFRSVFFLAIRLKGVCVIMM